MSNQIAIAELNAAVRMSDLPPPEDTTRAFVKNDAGEVIAANMAFKVGAMHLCVMGALGALDAEEQLKGVREAIADNGALAFLKRAASGEYRIVSSGDLTNLQIAEAQAKGRFYVEPNGGLGWALVPWDLTTRKDRERETQYFHMNPEALATETG
jgi:hypothetical protein